MGIWNVWREKEKDRMDVWGCTSSPMARVVGVWLGQLYGGAEWRLMDV